MQLRDSGAQVLKPEEVRILVRAAGTEDIAGELDGVLYLGRLHNHTAAPYHYQPGAQMSHLAAFELGKNRIHVVWAKHLSTAIKHGATKPDVGDEIGAIIVGRKRRPPDPSKPREVRYENTWLVERRGYFERAFGLAPSSAIGTRQRAEGDKPQSASEMVSKLVDGLAVARGDAKRTPAVRARPGEPESARAGAAAAPSIKTAFETPEQQVMERVKEFQKSPIPPMIDENHFKSINRQLLQGLSPDAGDYRRFNFTTTKNVVTLQATPFDQLELRGRQIFQKLAAQKHLKGLAREEFVEGLAQHFNELNRWSPFSRGNAPTTMLYLNQLADKAGYRLDLFAVDRNQLRRAVSMAALNGDLTQLKDVLRSAATPHRAVAFAEAQHSGQRHEAMAKHPELQYAFRIVDQLRSSNRREYERVVQKVQGQLNAGRLSTEPSASAVTRLTAASRAHAQ